MTDEPILPDFRGLRAGAVGWLGNLIPHRRNRPCLWCGLRWQQWLVLFVMGAAVIGIEVHNHTTMWREHHSGQTFWTDPELCYEVILFGLVFPLLAGVMLGRVGRTTNERDEMARELSLRRAFVSRLHAAQSWRELAELVVTLPGSIVSADRAWLLAQRAGEEEFDQVAGWEGPGARLLPPSDPVVPVACERCSAHTSRRGTRVLACHHAHPGSADAHPARYCLWLFSDGAGRAALLFDLPANRPLVPDQLKMLDDLGDEISLAIGNANLHYVRQRQDEVARNERLRIARDLHDTLGQNISYLRLKLERLSDTGPDAGRTDVQDELAKMLVVAEEAYEQVRDTLEELRSAEQGNCDETVRLYAAKAAERAGFSVQVRASGERGTLSTRRMRQLMYIVREALNNIEKHARAQNVDIHLQWRDDEFRLTVCDDGQGFDPKMLTTENQYGMVIMQERARAVHAELTVESSPGAGTELRVRVPLSAGAGGVR